MAKKKKPVTQTAKELSPEGKKIFADAEALRVLLQKRKPIKQRQRRIPALDMVGPETLADEFDEGPSHRQDRVRFAEERD